jgi:hypothetical protein
MNLAVLSPMNKTGIVGVAGKVADNALLLDTIRPPIDEIAAAEPQGLLCRGQENCKVRDATEGDGGDCRRSRSFSRRFLTAISSVPPTNRGFAVLLVSGYAAGRVRTPHPLRTPLL